MKIVIEDYNGNDLCSFRVNTFANNDGVDEYSELYIRIQLEKE